MNSSRHFRAAFAVLFLVSALMLASCEERAAVVGVDTAPIRAWVGGPMDGIEIPLGENPALCHAFAVAGVSQIELWVNGAFANRMANPDPGATYFTAELSFEVPEPGAYVLECRTTDQDGLNAGSDPVTVHATGEVPTATSTTEIPTATPTATEVSPTEVPPTSTSIPPTPTEVPPTSIPPTSTRIPPTSTPLPPSPTPEPPRIVSFEVSKSQITLGECVTFSYVVAGSPTAIYFDGQGVAGPAGSVDRCPTATREFELRAELNNQVADRATLTVVVLPGDTTGPEIARWAVSPGLIYWNEYDNCTPREVTVNAYNITDPSGVSAVKVVYRMKNGTWQSKGMTQMQTGMYSATIGPNDLEKSLNPPVTYQGESNSLECRVQAFDTVGNQSQSDVRTVTVQYCVIVR